MTDDPSNNYSYSSDVDANDCLVCLNRVGDSDAFTTACGHTFHRECIERWLSHSDKCPACRHPLSSPRSPPPQRLPQYQYSDQHYSGSPPHVPYPYEYRAPIPSAPYNDIRYAPLPQPPMNADTVRNNFAADVAVEADDDNRCVCGVFRCCYLNDNCRSFAFAVYGSCAIILLFIMLDLIIDKKEVHDVYYIVGCVVTGLALLFNMFMCLFVACRGRCRNCVWYVSQPPIQY